MFGYLQMAIKKPDVAMRYLRKYTLIGIWRAQYRLQSMTGYDPHSARLKNILRLCDVNGCNTASSILKDKHGRTFLCEEFDNILIKMSSDQLFINKVIDQADHVLNQSFYALYDYHNNMYDEQSGHYKWHQDYTTSYRYKKSFYFDTRKVNNTKGVDIKHIWEIARMQYLFAPALAYRLTGNEKYAEKVKHILIDFIHENPKGIGPNWHPSMEVGIRLANIILALELIINSPCLDELTSLEILCSLYEHSIHILQNEENTSGRTSNHYLGGLVGLAAYSSFVPFMRNSRNIYSYVCASLSRELDTQILNDGGDYEGSLSYHRLVGELLGFTIIACQNRGYRLEQKYIDRYQKMSEFTFNLMDSNGIVPQIGDNDCGRLFQLLPEDTNDHTFFVNLCSGICNNSHLFERNRLESSIFLGDLFHNKKRIIKKELMWSAPDFRITRLSNDRFTVIFSAIDAQRFGMGGHTHNDALSIVLFVDEKPVVVDSGTGCYTGNPELRNRLRGCGSHSTVSCNGNEQRRYSDNSLFSWNSTMTTKISNFSNAKTNAIEANARYGEIEHFRRLTLTKDKVTITDRINSETALNFLEMVLPLGSGIQVKIISETETKLFYNDQLLLTISGSWKIGVGKTIISDRYDNFIEVDKLTCTSNSMMNNMTFELPKYQ